MTNPSSEITPREAAARKDLVYVDVREPHEWDICHLPGARLIPLKQVGARRGEVPRDQTVVLYCHHGMRSGRAQRLLLDAGWTKVLNLAGGIDRWAADLDPTMNRY
jgi:adenylyltransferase/sulfurtransferase